MKIFKIFVDIDKEEKYLNEMAAKGYIFRNYSAFGVYTFEKAEPQNTNYRIDYRVFNKKSNFNEYVTLFGDCGWQHICGKRYSGSQYFLPFSDKNQNDDIFSDVESKANVHKRLSIQCFSSFAIMFLYVIIVFGNYKSSFSNLGYLTPGLWQKTGLDFLRAFWFETPFVIMRVLLPFFMLFLTVVYGYWAYKAYKLYKQKQKRV